MQVKLKNKQMSVKTMKVKFKSKSSSGQHLLDEELWRDFLNHYEKKLEINRMPQISFEDDEENASNSLGKTAFYNPEKLEVVVYVTGRHPKDILRSIGHELCHHKQNERGDLSNQNFEEGYTQSNNHLRSMEEEAYKIGGGLLFRDWEDGYKARK